MSEVIHGPFGVLPSTVNAGDTALEGSDPRPARGDHRHAASVGSGTNNPAVKSARKTALESRTNTTTVAVDSELQLTFNKTEIWQVSYFFTFRINAAGVGMKYKWNVTSTGSLGDIIVMADSNAVTLPFLQNVIKNTAGGAASVEQAMVGQFVYAGPGGAGTETVQFFWAMTSGGATLVFNAQSNLTAVQLA